MTQCRLIINLDLTMAAAKSLFFSGFDFGLSLSKQVVLLVSDGFCPSPSLLSYIPCGFYSLSVSSLLSLWYSFPVSRSLSPRLYLAYSLSIASLQMCAHERREDRAALAFFFPPPSTQFGIREGRCRIEGKKERKTARLSFILI